MIPELMLKSKMHLAALRYAQQGYRVFPCYPNTKTPAISDNLNQATTDPALIDKWWGRWPDANIAVIPPRGLTIIDIDTKNGAEGDKQWQELGGPGFPTYKVTTPSGGLHLYYRGDLPSSNGKIAKHIDARGSDGKYYIMVPPSIVGGVPYRGQVDGPAWPELIFDLPPFLQNWSYEHPVSEIEPDQIARNLQTLLQAIEHIPNDDLTWAEWNDVGMAIWAATEGSDEGLEAWFAFSQRSPKFDWDETNDRWSHYFDSPPTSIGAGSLYHWAEENGWTHERAVPGFANIGDDLILGMENALADANGTKPAARKFVNSPQGITFEEGRLEHMKKIQWLWKGHYARGKLHLRAGPPDVGKNVTAIDVAATVSKGGRWPDGSACPQGDILIWSGEDNWEDTTLPRLVAAGADISHCHRIVSIPDQNNRRVFDPSIDVRALCEAMRDPKYSWAYVLIDPISVVVGTGHNSSHNDAETRRALQPLVDLAEERGIVVEGIIHYAKSSVGRTVLERIIGATAFGAVARVVHAIARVGEERRMVRVKCNLAQPGGAIGYAFTFHSHPVINDACELIGEYPTIHWGKGLEGNPEELLTEDKPKTDPGVMLACKAWLYSYLQEHGETHAGELTDLAINGYGYARKTFERARGELTVEGKIEKTLNWHGKQNQVHWRCVPGSDAVG
jgi:putative DNA primase/helicase